LTANSAESSTETLNIEEFKSPASGMKNFHREFTQFSVDKIALHALRIITKINAEHGEQLKLFFLFKEGII
jgi:hypothetical protein